MTNGADLDCRRNWRWRFGSQDEVRESKVLDVGWSVMFYLETAVERAAYRKGRSSWVVALNACMVALS